MDQGGQNLFWTQVDEISDRSMDVILSLELQWSVLLQVIACYRDRDTWMSAYHKTLDKTETHSEE